MLSRQSSVVSMMAYCHIQVQTTCYYRIYCHWLQQQITLTHWGWGEITHVRQSNFSNALSCKKMIELIKIPLKYVPESHESNWNKANLRDLIAATGLVISNWIQIVNFSARVTVQFDGWPCKTIGHLFYATSSFVHHFVPIGEFKLKLQSGNAQSGSNWMIFRAVRPSNLTDDLAKQ